MAHLLEKAKFAGHLKILLSKKRWHLNRRAVANTFLQIQKTGENTEYVARQLARLANVRQRDIGFAGMKDRHAITTQWFSVWLPKGDEPDWQNFEMDGFKNSVDYAPRSKIETWRIGK